MPARLHNAAFAALRLPALYLPFPAQGLPDVWHGTDTFAAGMPLCGVTVVAPYKEAALELADRAGPDARAAGSANVLCRSRLGVYADTTDTSGIRDSLARAGVRVRGRNAAVIGCGGAGRAAATALLRSGAAVTVVNRGRARGQYAADLLGVPFVPLADFVPDAYSLLVHATPVADQLPFPVDGLRPDAVLVELVYGSAPTPLVREARARGHVVVDGIEVLVVEVMQQFQHMTGLAMPRGLVESLVSQQVVENA